MIRIEWNRWSDQLVPDCTEILYYLLRRQKKVYIVYIPEREYIRLLREWEFSEISSDLSNQFWCQIRQPMLGNQYRIVPEIDIIDDYRILHSVYLCGYRSRCIEKRPRSVITACNLQIRKFWLGIRKVKCKFQMCIPSACSQWIYSWSLDLYG